MATFKYTAFRQNKTIVSGNLKAEDIKEARRLVREMNLVPTSISEVQEKQGKEGKQSGAKAISALSLREKIDFTSTLEILTSTAIPII